MPEAITLTFTVSNSAPSSVTNTVIVSGGGDTDPANNTATDLVTLAPNYNIPTLSPELLLLLAAILGFIALRTMRS